MADQTGNYINSFYMTGGVLMLAFVIPFALIFIKRRKSKVHSQVSTKMSDVEATNGTSKAIVIAKDEVSMRLTIKRHTAG